MANYDLVENDDGTFTLTLYLFDRDASPQMYAILTSNARDTVYNLLNNVIETDGRV